MVVSGLVLEQFCIVGGNNFIDMQLATVQLVAAAYQDTKTIFFSRKVCLERSQNN